MTPGTQRRAESRDLPLQSSGTYTWQPLEGEVTLSFVDCHARVTLSLILQTQVRSKLSQMGVKGHASSGDFQGQLGGAYS